MFGAILAAATIPTAIGATIAVAEGNAEATKARRTAFCNLSIRCSPTPSNRLSNSKRRFLDDRGIMLRGGKLYVSSNPPDTIAEPLSGAEGYPFNGFFMTYPNDSKVKPLGLVSISSSAPPALSFIYVDRGTLELRYGNRSTSLPHIVGQWDWTADETCLTLLEEESFVAVEEEDGVWRLYFDLDGDWGRFPAGVAVVQVGLVRALRER